MNGQISSQYFSAIMMIAPLVGDITIDVVGDQASKPFIDITIDTMKKFGVSVTNNNYKSYSIVGNQLYTCNEYTVEPDATAASYFWGIAAITQSTIKVRNLTSNSQQGDVIFADVLEKMGCTVNKEADGITVQGNAELKSIEINMNNIPDVVPTMAVVAAFAKGTTTITGLHHLKGKESDRIEAPKAELSKMGVTVMSTDQSLTITGTNPHGAKIETYGDHRIAMAFAVAGTKISDVTIIHPEVVSKSFPTFWDVLHTIGIETKEMK